MKRSLILIPLMAVACGGGSSTPGDGPLGDPVGLVKKTCNSTSTPVVTQALDDGSGGMTYFLTYSGGKATVVTIAGNGKHELLLHATCNTP